MKILIVEDSHERIVSFTRNGIGHDLVFAESYSEAVQLLSEFQYDGICLDHDLEEPSYRGETGPHIKTGYDVARWMEDNLTYLPKFMLTHSLNKYGAERIHSCFVTMTTRKPGECKTFIAPFFWKMSLTEFLNSKNLGVAQR